MSGTTTPTGEVRARHAQKMGAVLGPVYHELFEEVAELHFEWGEYRRLFATSDERIELLNQVGGHFFGMIQRTLFDRVVLHLSQLLEGPRVSGHQVLGLPQLADSLDPGPLKDEICRLIDDATTKCMEVRRWRDTRVAHRSLKLAMQENRNTGISRAMIEDVLQTTRDIMNSVQSHYFSSTTDYQDQQCPSGGDADAICAYLERGVASFDRHRARLHRGEHQDAD